MDSRKLDQRPTSLNTNIVEDIKRVANDLGSVVLSRAEYVQTGRFSYYQIYDGGTTWEDYCSAAGVATRKKEAVPDEVYFDRLRKAQDVLGRFPKSSERKEFGLNFSKRRYPTLRAFVARATELRYVNSAKELDGDRSEQQPIILQTSISSPPRAQSTSTRLVPPIPVGTRRRKWERTGVDGFPYAPQDESGVVAMFAILCARRELGDHEWSILELRQCKGIDATCYDHKSDREIRVELKYRLSKAVWDKRTEDVDYVVCWESAWPDFPKPVVVLRELLHGQP